ncbi:MAG TPA: SRPBCC family protein [Thermoanaerobaculia bacterium]|jgi:carbon monoxide dehydrogenase subunit G|nr:SRPBCC family protein [Thermoanaerobaculia bacterium]
MATIRRDIAVDATPEAAWAAVRDVGNAHQLFAGVLTACTLEDGARIVTFANGTVVRELIVTVDDDARRFAWSARGERFVHHNASLEVLPGDAGKSRVVWIADVLPGEVAPAVGGLMDAGAAAMQRTLRGR